jgi:hypothetical protein
VRRCLWIIFGDELYVKAKRHSKRDKEKAPKNRRRKEAGKARKEEQISRQPYETGYFA